MALETVTVTRTGKDSVFVSLRQESLCGKCAAGQVCGLQLLRGLSAGGRADMPLALPMPLPLNLSPGQALELEIDDSRLAGLAMLHFLVPVACLLAAVILAAGLGAAPGQGELPTIVAAAAALGAGFLLVRHLVARQADGMPLILKINRASPSDVPATK